MTSSQPESSGRPSKVTLAASMGGVSCLVLIISLFDTLARLRGVDMRDQVTKSLSEPPFDTLAVTTAEVLSGMRVLAYVSGALAAAGVVLAIYAARRHQGARIGFTAVAAMLLLTTPVAGMLTFLVGIAAVLLWSEPARAWFAGRTPAEATARRREEMLMSAGDRSGGAGRGGSGSGSGGSNPGGPAPQGWPYGEPDRTGEEPSSSSAASGRGAPSWSSQVPPPPPSGEPSGGSSDEPSGAPGAPPPYPGSYGEAPPTEPAPPEPAPPEQPQPQTQPQPWEQSGQQPWQQGQPGQAPPQSGPYGPGVGYPPAGPYGGQADYPQQPYGQGQYGQGQHGQGPYGQQPYGGYPAYGGGSDKRPGTVTWAAALAIVGSLFGLLAGGMLMVGLGVASDTLGDEIRKDPNFSRLGWDVDQVLAVVWVSAVVLVIWSLSALVLAIFTLRRQQWARWLLVVSATATALMSLLAISSLVSFVPMVMAVATVVLLFTGGANAWFSKQDHQSPSGPQWSSQPGPW